MIAAILGVFRAVKAGLKNPEYRVFFLAVAFVLVGGTLFYHFYEGWSWIDSVYFVVVSLATVGYGDLAPSTELSRFITIGFIFFGVTLIGVFINLLLKAGRQRHQARWGHDGDSDEAGDGPD